MSDDFHPTSSQAMKCDATDSVKAIFEHWFTQQKERQHDLEHIKGYMFIAFLTGMSAAFSFKKDDANSARLEKELLDISMSCLLGVN